MLDIVVSVRINQASESYKAVEVKVHAILRHTKFVHAPEALSLGKVLSTLYRHNDINSLSCNIKIQSHYRVAMLRRHRTN
jgi:hypothetical protein